MLQIDRRQFTASLAGAASLAASSTRALASNFHRRPNIVFIMADDLGYADLSCYGRRDFETPHCDRLAEAGMRFEQAYANSPVCSATRTALITGRYQYRLAVGLEEPLNQRPVGLPPSHPTLPSVLRQAGYHTALVGKWHLGALPDFGPLTSGYDHFFGFRGGGVDYFNHSGTAREADLWDGDQTVEETGYLTTLLGDRAVELIESFSASTSPFFLSLHFSAPHWPWEAMGDQAEAERLSLLDNPLALLHFDGGSMTTYAAMVREMDRQVGRISATLERLGLTENTLVIFTSDNGGERFSDTWPFTGVKTELLEGGIRVPAIASWPGVLRAGSVSLQVIASMDWMPTLLRVAGTAPDPAFPSDGVDILSIDPATPQSRTLFWRYQHMLQEACRDGDMKYLRIDGHDFLFDLSADPRERANLKHRMPDEFERLKNAYSSWETTMLPRDPDAFTHGFGAEQLADHFGATMVPD